MKYHQVAGVITSAFTLLASATVPDGCTHQDDWGNAVVQNDCSVPVYFVLDNQPATATIAPASQTSIPIYEKDADKGGMSIKLFKKKDTDIWSIPALTQFEITATTSQFWDVSNVNSDIGKGKNGNGEDCDGEPPFLWDGLRVTTEDGKDITCAKGENPCKNAYSLYNDDFATSASPLGSDITLTLCLGGSGTKKEESPKEEPTETAPAPEPKKDDNDDDNKKKTEDKPKVEEKVEVQAEADDDGETVIVTKVVKVQAPAATIMVDENGNPIEGNSKAKRHEHVHQHIHNKIHKRRHWT